jgi:hypothetical protein
MERTLLCPAKKIKKHDDVFCHPTSSGDLRFQRMRRDDTSAPSRVTIVINKGTYEYGPIGVSLFPTPLLSNTRTEYCGNRPKCFTCADQLLQLTLSLYWVSSFSHSIKKLVGLNSPHDEYHLYRPCSMLFKVQRIAWSGQVSASGLLYGTETLAGRSGRVKES